MSEKQQVEIVSQVISNKEKELTEKEHIWTDQQLYHQEEGDDQLTCWQKFKRCSSNFFNRTVDYFEFDRLFEVQGQRRIDLRRCNKRFLQNYDETYSEREMKFGYTFEYVLMQKIKEEERKEKNFCTELYRFICCEGGNEMVEIDEAYKSDREYQILIKKKIMERKQEYEEEKKREEEKRLEEIRREEERKIEQERKIEEERKIEQQKKIEEENKLRGEKVENDEQVRERVKNQEIPVQNFNDNVLSFYEEPEGNEVKPVGEVSHHKMTSYLNIKKVHVKKDTSESIQQIQQPYANEITNEEHKNSGRSYEIVNTNVKRKQLTYTHTRQSAENGENMEQPEVSNQNQVSIPHRTSSEFALKNKKNPTIEQRQVIHNIYHQNHIYKDVYHETNTTTHKNRKYAREPQDQPQNEQMQKRQAEPLEETSAGVKKKKKIKKQEQEEEEGNQIFVSNQRNESEGQHKVQAQNIFYASPREEDMIEKSPKITFEAEPEAEDQYISRELPRTKKAPALNQAVEPQRTMAVGGNKKFDSKIFLQQDLDFPEQQSFPEDNMKSGKQRKKKRQLKNQQEDDIDEIDISQNKPTLTHTQAFAKKASQRAGEANDDPNAVMYRTDTGKSNNWVQKNANVPNLQVVEENEGHVAKKKRKKREMKTMEVEGDQEQIVVENDHPQMKNSRQRQLYSNTISGQPSLRDTISNQQQTIVVGSKKKRVRKQIKKQPSDDKFQQVVMDTLDFTQNDAKDRNNLAYTIEVEEDLPVSQVKAEKKRRKAKGKKKPEAEEILDQIIDLDL